MATVVNNPPESNNGMGYLLGMILLIGFVAFVLFYGLPMLRGGTGSVTLPSTVNVNTK